jgi:hypothetical protein
MRVVITTEETAEDDFQKKNRNSFREVNSQ